MRGVDPLTYTRGARAAEAAAVITRGRIGPTGSERCEQCDGSKSQRAAHLEPPSSTRSVSTAATLSTALLNTSSDWRWLPLTAVMPLCGSTRTLQTPCH